jgi:hypothetical protein
MGCFWATMWCAGVAFFLSIPVMLAWNFFSLAYRRGVLPCAG